MSVIYPVFMSSHLGGKYMNYDLREIILFIHFCRLCFAPITSIIMLSFINMTSSSIIWSLKTVLRTNYVLLNFLIFFFCFSCNSEIKYYENKYFFFFKRFSSLSWFLISFVTPLKCRFCPSISKSRKVFYLLFLISSFFLLDCMFI